MSRLMILCALCALASAAQAQVTDTDGAPRCFQNGTPNWCRGSAPPPSQPIRPVSHAQEETPLVDFDEVLTDSLTEDQLMRIPEYRSLQERLQTTETQLARLQQNRSTQRTNPYRYSSYQQQNGMSNGQSGGGAGGGGDLNDTANQSQNPVGGLWMLWFQNDTTLNEGPLGGKRIFNTTVFQPVMPIQLTENWRVINRPIFMMPAYEVPNMFQFNPGGSFPPPVAPADPFNTVGGLGDTVFAQFFSAAPDDSKVVWGIGETWMFPTATEDEIGTGKTSLGPAALAMYLGENFIGGAIVQQWWSFDRADSRQRVSLMDIQAIYRIRLNPLTSIGGSPNIRWDQVSNKWTVPIGLGFDTMTMAFGKMPIRLGAEVQYFLSHERSGRDFDPEWNFRFYVVPIIPSPECAKEPLFGR